MENVHLLFSADSWDERFALCVYNVFSTHGTVCVPRFYFIRQIFNTLFRDCLLCV